MRRIIAIFLVMMVGQLAQAQKADSTKYLLTDFALQLENADERSGQSEDEQPETLPIAQPSGHTGTINTLAFSPDGKWLASGSADRSIRLWSVSDPTLPSILLYGHTNNVAVVRFSPNGRQLASASFDGTVRLWDVNAILAGLAGRIANDIANTIATEYEFSNTVSFRVP